MGACATEPDNMAWVLVLLFIFRSELSILVKTQPNWGGVEKGEFGPGGGGMSRDGKDMGRSIYFIDFYGDKWYEFIMLEYGPLLGLLKYLEIERQSNKYEIIRYHSDACCALSLLWLL